MNKELNVRIGDEVLYTCGSVGNTIEKIVKVVKVTPSGRIKIDFMDGQFNKYGRTMGDTGAWYGPFISELTEDDRKRIKTKEAVNKALSMIEKTKLTYEQAMKIIEILEGEHDGK